MDDSAEVIRDDEYPEDDSNNNQEDEGDERNESEEEEDDDDDVNTNVMSNDRNAGVASPSHRASVPGASHMKDSPSDDEFYGNPSPMKSQAPRGNFSQMDKTGPRGLNLNDTMSENSSQAPGQMVRSKSRVDMFSGASSRYQNLSYWKARRMIFYRNGDPFFPGVEYRFKPGRDVTSLESLLDKVSPKMDLPRGARYVFSMDGDRKYTLDELEDGASYVLSSTKVFKVSIYRIDPTNSSAGALSFN